MLRSLPFHRLLPLVCGGKSMNFGNLFSNDLFNFIQARLSSSGSNIQSSIEMYLMKVRANEALMADEREKFEQGKRVLARMMGEDPDNFSQESVDAAIRYLFPSALFNIGSRPKLKVGLDGRPLHHLFYTGKPAFYDICYEATQLLTKLKGKVDAVYIFEDNTCLKEAFPVWLTKAELEKRTLDKLKDHQYERWLRLMDRLASHPLASLALDFINQYRVTLKQDVVELNLPEPAVDSLNPSRQYVEAYGQKKNAFTELRMYMPGSGRISVNGRSILDTFPELGNREQIMFPLVLTGRLGKVDIEANVTGPYGSSSKANSLRLAIARALSCFLPKGEGEHQLLVAGLLTQDDRTKERKKPGQKKARKKPIWKAR